MKRPPLLDELLRSEGIRVRLIDVLEQTTQTVIMPHTLVGFCRVAIAGTRYEGTVICYNVANWQPRCYEGAWCQSILRAYRRRWGSPSYGNYDVQRLVEILYAEAAAPEGNYVPLESPPPAESLSG